MSGYIVQYMTKYLNLQHLNKSDDDFTRYYDKTIIHPEFAQLYDYPYCFIIAEPGYGKTRLLKEIVLQASEYSKKAFFIDSKKVDNDITLAIKKCKPIDPNIDENSLQKLRVFSNTDEYDLDERTIICLDALDELPFAKLFSFFEMLETFIQENQTVQLFISCRIHHLQKIDFDLQTLPFEYIELSKFGHSQISTYLKNNLKEYKTIDQKIQDHGLNEFLSIPRYLYYFVELIQDKPIESILKLTRIELFENFIYRKLDKERGGKIPHSQYDVIKRVLEKIALLMKMYQVSQLSKDELLTVFEHIDSSLGHILFRDDLLTILYEKSVLKDNLDSIEFENKEFLDFLAAKELLRFEHIEQIFFDLVFEPYLMEVYTEWFYVMPFLFEQHEQLLSQFVDYLVKNQHKILRDEYFEALTSIEPKLIKPEIRDRIFHLVFDYYTDHKKWFLSIGHYTLSKNLVGFGNGDLVHEKTILSVDDTKDYEQLYVTRVNAVEIIASKFLDFNSEQKKFWNDKFSEWLKLKPYDQYTTLHRHIVSEASIFAKDDFDWIKKHRFIFEQGIQLQNEYAHSCFDIAPEEPFSIDVYFEAHDYFDKNKRDRSLITDDSIRYIARLKTPDAIAYSLKKLMEGDEKKYLNRLLYQYHLSTSGDFIQSYLKHISNVLNDEIVQLLKEMIVILINENRGIHGRDLLIEKILYILITDDENYIDEIIKYIFSLYQANTIYYHEAEFFITDHLAKYFSKNNFQSIYKQLKCFDNEKHSFVDFAYRLYIDKSLNSKVAELIFQKHKHDIQQIELERQKYLDEVEKKSKPKKNICQEWEYKIEPEPEQYMTDLFRFYLQEKNNLINCPNFESNKHKTIEWAKTVLEKNNPLKNGKVEKTSESSHTVWQIPWFNDCIELLLNENEQLSPTAVDNTFRFLPFNINGDYVNTLKLAKNPSTEAIIDVIEVYSGKREDDLATYHPQNLIEAYKHLRIKEAEPLLLNMVENAGIADFIKIEILDALPVDILTKTKIDKLLERDEGKKISEKLLAILVQKHNDEDALKRVIKCIKITAKKTRVKNDDGSLWSTDLDLRHHPMAFVLINHEHYRIDIDEELLLLAADFRNKNKKTNAYFLEEIVFGHMKFLRNMNSLDPLHRLERFLQQHQNKIELHWFEYKFIELKSYYLEKMAKPPHIMNVLKKYQSLQEKEYMVVSSPIHLLEIIQDIIDKDLKSWVENEGAYKYINELAKKEKNKNAEDFIQKTVKSQIELALIKRGFRPSDLRIKREEQTLDDKRADFTISYGLIGQILIELKLDRNPEAIASNAKGKEYTKILHRYIKGTNSDFGIFLIFNVNSARAVFDMQMQKLIEHYSSEELISVMGINCKV